jgi:hypothetical protein
MDTAIEVREHARKAALDRLMPHELAAYEDYRAASKPDLSLDTNKRLYGLYLHGLKVQELADMNPAIPFGALIKARVDGRWDERREEYLGELLGGVGREVKQLAAEAVGFLALQLTVFHHRYGQMMRRYLQTGDEKDFLAAKAAIPDSIRDQKTVIEMLARLLEAGKQPKDAPPGAGGPLVSVHAGPGATVSMSATGEKTEERRFTPEEAEAIRASIEKKRV